MDLKTINQRIAHVLKAGVALNEYIHTTAVGILEHAKEHGDCTPALRLVLAMPKSFRRGLLIEWFAAYSPIGMNVSTGKVAFNKPEAKAYNPFDIDAAKTSPWYASAAANKEDLPDTTTAEAQKKVFGLAKQLQKKLDNGDVAVGDRDNVIDLVARLNDVAKRAYRPRAKPAPVAPGAAPEGAVVAA